MFEHLLWIIAAIPFFTLLIIIWVPENKEKVISKTAFYLILIQTIFIVYTSIVWVKNGLHPINFKEWSLYHTSHFDFFIDFYFDITTCIFLILGSFITLTILKYSTYYMHKERGFKRFFLILTLFYGGYVFTAISGSFENLFVGWEILGISSFLLIAFYRDRYLPVKHAVRVFSIYRIGDVGILLAIWASHHLWSENITFAKLANQDLVHHQLADHSFVGIWVSLGLVLAAWAKSAQWPFSSWLPRAMEGPTPSSAVFYGSLSVHFGLFLMIRSFPIWEFQISVRWLVGLMGIFTSIVSYAISRVQPTIKTQIAYASVSQIGLMFLEVSFGWINLALLHLMGNALLRTYQLLISPSLVAYRIREQIYSDVHRPLKVFPFLSDSMNRRIYIESLMEFQLDKRINRWFFKPLKDLGRNLHFLKNPTKLKVILLYWTVSLILLIVNLPSLDFLNNLVLPHLLSFIAMLMTIKAFSERQSPNWSIGLILLSNVFIVTGISFNETVPLSQIIYYMSGIVLGSLINFIVISYLNKKLSQPLNLHEYYGWSSLYPKLSNIFLIGILCMAAFPITPSVIGEDILFSHIRADQVLLTLMYSFSYILGGIALIRVYSRLFMGSQKYTHAPINKITT